MKPIKITFKQDIEKFTNDYIIKLLIQLYSQELKNNKKSEIFNYIKNNYSISIEDIIKKMLDKNIYHVISYNKDNTYYKEIEIEKLAKVKNTSLITLIDLIDFGVIGIRGLNIYNKLNSFIQRNIGHIYLVYNINNKRKK